MNKQYLLKENESYPFLIIKEVELGEDEIYFVLEDPSGNRHLLNKTGYENYSNLKPENTVSCHIDKINCTGKIFLEPEHPFYKKSELYSFQIVSISEIVNAFGKDLLRVKVIDKFNEYHELDCVPRNNALNESDSIDLKVECIKKGKLQLSDPELQNQINQLKLNESYFFTFSELIDYKGKTYMVFLDQFSQPHLIVKSYYSNYKLNENAKVKAKVISYNPEGFYNLEPHHPQYKEGKIYNFKFVRTYQKKKTQQNSGEVNIVLDCFNNELFAAPKKNKKDLQKGDQLKYMVEKIRKGKPVLRNL